MAVFNVKTVLVAVDKCSYGFDRLFTYLVPNELNNKIHCGKRVTVPFGRGDTLRLGIVFEVKDIEITVEEQDRLKFIRDILDDEPLLDTERILLAKWLVDRTFCTYFSAAKVMLPAGACVLMENVWTLCENIPDEILSDLTPAEKQLYLSFDKKHTSIKEKDLIKMLSCDNASYVIKKAAEKHIITKETSVSERVKALSCRKFTVTDDTDLSTLSEKQYSVAEFLQNNGSATAKEICYYTGVGLSVLNTMLKNGVLNAFEEQVLRAPKAEPKTPKGKIKLSDEQQKAYETLCGLYASEKSEIALLFGVTGSGKTGVYMELIERVVSENKGVIVLVPEISLTPQCAALFSERFGKKIALLHSGLSIGERFDEWNRIKNGDASIVIGTRSAVFAPVKNLGLIVVDEEQEHTYKSETSPRYNAKDVARFRCAYNNAMLLLASATPSIESFAKAKSGKYALIELKNRYGTATLPEVHTVDMTDKSVLEHFLSLSTPLIKEIEKNNNAGQQSIILVNRRGYNTFVVCRECKRVVTCPNCSISLTYHSANNRLMCHYCGYSVPFSTNCPVCGADNVRYSGFGTQKVQQELEFLFPDKKILRMDADTTTAKNAHDRALTAFSEGEYDIMIGTQMVAKGLDFPNVTLVGIATADSALFGDDFRGSERVFDLLTQVVGRAGRGTLPGRAVIQTVAPENDIIQLAATQNYSTFYDQEIIIRKALIYPPFCDICTVSFSCIDEKLCDRCANDFFGRLSKTDTADSTVKMIILGPIAPKIEKINNRHRRRITIKTKNTAAFRDRLSFVLKELSNEKEYRTVSIFADMNPETCD